MHPDAWSFVPVYLVCLLVVALISGLAWHLLIEARLPNDLDAAWVADVGMAVRGALPGPYAVRQAAQRSCGSEAIEVVGSNGRARLFVVPPGPAKTQAERPLLFDSHPAVALLIIDLDAAVQSATQREAGGELRVPPLMRCPPIAPPQVKSTVPSTSL